MTSFGDSKIISSELHQSLAKQVDGIAEQTISKKKKVKDSGLLGGKAGITLLLGYLSKVFPDKKFSLITQKYLDELSDRLVNEALPHNFSAGVAGIGFVFQHLKNIGALNESNEFDLSELDEFIDLGIENDFQSGNWDPLHGMVGLGVYFLERDQETGEKKFLEKIVNHLEEMRVAVGDHRLWITPGYQKYSNDNYNLGIAHGMPGLLAFLALVHARGIKQLEIEQMISSCIPFILEHEYGSDSICCFPSSIDVKPVEKKEESYSRLAWCYGDLCIANALVHCGKALHRNDWLNKGIEVALKTASRRNFENSGCTDAPFCHGSVGLVHQYHQLYQFTRNANFKDACIRWLAITQQQFYKPGEGAGGYFFRSYNEEKDIFEWTPEYGLLEGSAGIALVYLSLLFNIKPEWDRIFLTNIN